MSKSKQTFGVQKIEGERFKLEDIVAFKDFMENAPPGRYVMTIAKERPPKTPKQCAVIFALMIGQAVQQAQEKCIGVEELMRYLLAQNIPMGVAIDKDYLHALMYVICPTVNDKGEKITLSKMNTKQASNLFERFRNIVAPLGIVIDDPDPEWKKRLSEVESTLRKGE